MINIRDQKDLIKDILILAFPAIIEMALNTLVGMADTLMISRFIGPEGLAAVGFANQIIFTLIYIFSSFNAGATAMVARSYGEKNYQRLNKIVGQNFTLNTFMGIIITLVTFLFSGNILGLFAISDIVHRMGTDYLNYVAISQLFMFISFASAAGLRGAGDTRTPMYITLLANILNIVGNYVLITGYSFFPELGIIGAAISTSFARGIAALIYLYIYIRGNRKVKLLFRNLRISSSLLKPLWKFSYAAGLEQFFMQMAFFVNGIIISLLDTTSEAAFRILINIESASFMPAIGISIATATMVGKRLGEDNPEKSLLTGKTAAGIGVIWGIIMGLVFILLPVPILRIFTTDSELIKSATFTMILAGFNQPLLSFMIVMGGALRGTGDTKGVMVITSLRLWTIFIPLTYIFVAFYNLGVASVWYAEITSFVVFSLIIYRRFVSMEWARITMF
jgi:putative MATE family efflux protein